MLIAAGVAAHAAARQSAALGRVLADPTFELIPLRNVQDQAAAIHTLSLRFQLMREFLHAFLIQGGLASSELAERLHFGLLRQVADDGLIGLQSP